MASYFETLLFRWVQAYVIEAVLYFETTRMT